MEYKPKGSQKRVESFKEFHLPEGTVIGIFQGGRGENPELDIIIKYAQKGKRVRTPKHIHWVVDVLIKKSHNRALTIEFLKYLRDMWDDVEPFRTKEEQQKCQLKTTTHQKIKKFQSLNQYGEYTVDFIGHVIELMMRMEKTGLARAYVFKDLLNTIIEKDDIFSIVAKATQTGQK